MEIQSHLFLNVAIKSMLFMLEHGSPIEANYSGTCQSNPSTHHNHKHKYTLSHTIKNGSWHIIIRLSHFQQL